MKHVILGTAGHIDHGKTTLIRALTGINTDRLPEEQNRGITIELGFAHMPLKNDILLGIVDVPGHEKFVHHMVAGVGGIDFVMLVIAGDEGIMPQTREHVDICTLLGVRKGFIALTKIDLVEPDWLALVEEDIRENMQGTFLEGAPVIPVSGTTGEGLDRIQSVIESLAMEMTQRPDTGVFRLPVDRVFTIKGFGTVVTGTVVSGNIRGGTSVRLIPDGPETRIRGMQVHNRSVDHIRAGQRAAVNLQGVDKNDIHRGMILCRDGSVPETYMVDIMAGLLPSVQKPLRNRTVIRFHAGTAELIGRLILLDRDTLLPGKEAPAQVRLDKKVALLPGDRVLLRSYSPVLTIGGGPVLDAEPVKHKRFDPVLLSRLNALRSGDPSVRLSAFLDAAGVSGLSREELERRFPSRLQELDRILEQSVRDGKAVVLKEINTWVHAKAWSRFKQDLCHAIDRFHVTNPLKLSVSREELRTSIRPVPGAHHLAAALSQLANEGTIEYDGKTARKTGFKPELTTEQESIRTALINIFLDVDITGARLEEIPDKIQRNINEIRPVFQYMLDMGELIRLPGGLIFHEDVIRRAKSAVKEFIAGKGQITVAAFRDMMGISRKQAVPLMEYFDACGFTRRVKDVRVLREP